jgi:hypothetical protein
MRENPPMPAPPVAPLPPDAAALVASVRSVLEHTDRGHAARFTDGEILRALLDEMAEERHGSRVASQGWGW